MQTHHYSFFGQKTAMILQSGDWTDPWMFLAFIKKRDNGSWEKLAEGKTIKLGLPEIVALRDVVAGNRPEWKAFHKSNGTGTSISARLESGNGEKDTPTVVIAAGSYVRPVNYPETVILDKLLGHVFEEKVANATVNTKPAANDTPQESGEEKPDQEPVSIKVPSEREKRSVPVTPSPPVTNVDLTLTQSFAAFHFPPLPRKLPNGAYPVTGFLKSVKKENGTTTLFLKLGNGNVEEIPAAMILGAGLHGTEVDLVIKGPGTYFASPLSEGKQDARPGNINKIPEVAHDAPTTGESSAAPTELATVRAASVRAVTGKALLVTNAKGVELWVPKRALADAVPAPTAPQDAAWQFAVKPWFAEKPDFQNWVKST